MSGEKDLSGPRETMGPPRARATLNQLKLMLNGHRLEVTDDHLIRIGMFNQREHWKLIGGKGASALYERLGEE